MSLTIDQNPHPKTFSEIHASLDRLSLQLLQIKFLEVNVKAYLDIAENHVQQTLKYNRKYCLEVAEDGPLGTLIRLSIDKVASAYVLITGETNPKKVSRFVDEYMNMVEVYLEKTGCLTTP
jgi:hypothetical protein